MVKEIVKSVALFYKDGSSDKEYNAFIEADNGGYTVNFAYGRRGQANSTGSKTTSPVTLPEAEKIYNKLVSEKMGKGYKPDGDATVHSQVAVGVSTGLIPQLLNPINEDEITKYINDPSWLLQEKLDGKRIMVKVDNGTVTASNRRGLICAIPSSIEQELSTLASGVFDGELIGSTYHMFDVLEYGQDMRGANTLRRFETLRALISGKGFKNLALVTCGISTAEKKAIFDALQHKEGVVVKHIHSPYVSGRPTTGGGNQLKCKFWSSCSVKVLQVNAKRSIKVGVLDGGVIVSVGNVSVPTNYDLPNIGEIVEVKYLYYYPGGSLFQPQYLGSRDDVDMDTLSSLKPKATDTDED